jgi:hypothetical protein
VSGELSPDSRKNFSGTNDLIPRDELLPREKNAKNGAGDGPYERRGGRDRGARALTDKVDRESLVLRREFIQRQASITSRQLAKIEEKEHALREKIELVGLTEANQLMLLEAYRKLPEEAKFRIQTVEYENEIKSASVEMLGFEERLSMRKRRWYDEAGIDEWEVADDPKITLPDDLAEIQAIVNEYRGLHQELLQLSAEREKLLHATREFRVFLSSNLLWVQNAEAVSGRDIQKSWQGLIQLAIPQPWIELGAGLGAQMVQRPVEVMAFVFGFVALQLGARRLSTAKRKPRGDMP